jgi:hypothetical protein
MAMRINGHENIAAVERVLNVLTEIESERNRIDIHEDIVFAEVTLQPIMDAARDPSGIFAAI